eukprot:1852532-Prymnesium_polylepis.1
MNLLPHAAWPMVSAKLRAHVLQAASGDGSRVAGLVGEGCALEPQYDFRIRSTSRAAAERTRGREVDAFFQQARTGLPDD